jgi:hypothetical protein
VVASRPSRRPSKTSPRRSSRRARGRPLAIGSEPGVGAEHDRSDALQVELVGFAAQQEVDAVGAHPGDRHRRPLLLAALHDVEQVVVRGRLGEVVAEQPRLGAFEPALAQRTHGGERELELQARRGLDDDARRLAVRGRSARELHDRQLAARTQPQAMRCFEPFGDDTRRFERRELVDGECCGAGGVRQRGLAVAVDHQRPRQGPAVDRAQGAGEPVLGQQRRGEQAGRSAAENAGQGHFLSWALPSFL